MSLSAPDIRVIKAYWEVRRLKLAFNRTQAKLIKAHEAYAEACRVAPGRKIKIAERPRVKVAACATPSHSLRRSKRTRRDIPGQEHLPLEMPR